MRPRPSTCDGSSPSAPARSSTPPAGLDREDAPVTKEPSSDPYTITKMAAFLDAMARAEKGRDVVSTHPGAIFGPSPVASNALGTTSFNRVLLSAARGRIERYLKFPVSWVYGEDIARGCILALDKGVSGERYMLDGRPEDVVSIANACNRMGQLAGLDHEVVDVEPSDDPELAKVFGPTLVAIAEKAAKATAGPAEARGLEDLQAAGLQPHQPRRGIGDDARLVPGDRQARPPIGRDLAVSYPGDDRIDIESAGNVGRRVDAGRNPLGRGPAGEPARMCP